MEKVVNNLYKNLKILIYWSDGKKYKTIYCSSYKGHYTILKLILHGNHIEIFKDRGLTKREKTGDIVLEGSD